MSVAWPKNACKGTGTVQRASIAHEVFFGRDSDKNVQGTGAIGLTPVRRFVLSARQPLEEISSIPFHISCFKVVWWLKFTDSED